SLAPRDLAALAWPWAVGWAGRTYWGGLPATDYPQYAGVLVMAVVLLGMARRGAWNDGPTQVFAAAVVLGAVLALGARLGGFYEMVRTVLPLWSRFRAAVAVILVAHFALAMLSARALSLMLESAPTRRIVWGTLAAVFLAGLVILSGPLLEHPHSALAGGARAGFPAADAAAAAQAAR